jgi:hypothetical protein
MQCQQLMEIRKDNVNDPQGIVGYGSYQYILHTILNHRNLRITIYTSRNCQYASSGKFYHHTLGGQVVYDTK